VNLKKIESLSSSLFEQIDKNIDQNVPLITLRDTLLPKLLSGELSISRAEYQLAEAAETVDVRNRPNLQPHQPAGSQKLQRSGLHRAQAPAGMAGELPPGPDPG